MWIVDSGASIHMAFNKKAFSRNQEEEASIQVELGDDDTYPIVVVRFISSRCPELMFLSLAVFYMFLI
jgi:hypothetical protein